MLSFSAADRTALLGLSLDEVAQKIPLQPLIWPELKALGLNLYLRRDDLISPTYSGNKFYKLYHNILAAIETNKSYLLSFGGAYSNHLYALAALGNELGLNTIGIVRGKEPQTLSPTLQDAQSWGMQLYFLDKMRYRDKNLSGIEPLAKLIAKNAIEIIPEGGANIAGVKGCMAIACSVASSFPQTPYTLCSATATGTSLAGLVAGSPSYCNNIGFSVLKGLDTITPTVNNHLSSLAVEQISRFEVKTNYHYGGYAKVNDALLDFIERFEEYNSLLIDPVYTAKLLYAIEQLALNGYWEKGTNIIAIHSGGVQGRRGYPQLSTNASK